jgi:8-hydroxy-5-deazaflavin:NADPH oxidoreductase
VPSTFIYSAAVAPSPSEPVAIIGASGALGFGLALRLGGTGVPVLIGSRKQQRAQETAQRAQDAVQRARESSRQAQESSRQAQEETRQVQEETRQVRVSPPPISFAGAENAEAAADAGIVILSVPFRNQSETLKNLREALSPGQLLIDATVPLAAAVSGRATRMLGVWQGSAAQVAQEMVPEGVKVVSALHTVSAASLTALDYDLDQDVLVCGDSREDKRRTAQLLERIDGLRCVDCGRLEMARIAESLTALMISINARHKTHAGIRITGLPDDEWA